MSVSPHMAFGMTAMWCCSSARVGPLPDKCRAALLEAYLRLFPNDEGLRTMVLDFVRGSTFDPVSASDVFFNDLSTWFDNHGIIAPSRHDHETYEGQAGPLFAWQKVRGAGFEL